MESNNWKDDKTGETTTTPHCADKSCGFGKVQTIIAEELRKVAETLSDKAAQQNAPSGLAQYGKQASEWLDQSADYVSQFDYHQADAKVRDYVRQNPGESLLLAGAVGLIIGAVWRRR